MDIRKKKEKGIIVISVLIVTFLFALSVLNLFSLKNNAVAVSSSANTTDIGDLLLSNYENKDKKFDGAKVAQLYAQITGKANATYNDVIDAATEKRTSADFRDANNTQTGGKLITFTMLDMEWNAMYLSTNRLGEPILSVWLASSSETSKWTEYSSSSCGTYPGNMYGSSYLRTETLNNTGKYFANNSGGGEKNYTQKSSGHIYARFTSPDAVGSLTEFIDEPAKVAWQENEMSTAVNEYRDDFNNDAYGEVPDAHWNANVINYYELPSDDAKVQYVAWKNDKIWIPSIAEVGWSDPNICGLWKTSPLERANAAGITSWLRSAVNTRYADIQTLVANGTTTAVNNSDFSGNAVRPAFHLNLAKVEQSLAKPISAPQDVELVYNGAEQGVDSKYTSDFLNGVEIKYYDEGSETPRATKPTIVGNYTVKYTAKTGYYWSDNLDGMERTKTFTIVQCKLNFPKFDNGEYELQKNYAGDAEILFTLNEFDKNFIEVSYVGTDSEVSYNSQFRVATAKYVGNYYLDVKIKDEHGSNCAFLNTPTSGKLKFEVTQAPVEVEIKDGNSNNIVGIRGSKKKVLLNIPDAQKKVHAGKKIYVQVVAKDRFDEYELSDIIEINGSKLQYSDIELNIGLLGKGTYDLEIKVVDGLDGASYATSVVNGAKLEVNEVEPGSQLIWQLYSGRDTDGLFVAANIGDFSSEYDSFPYDGKEYHFEVTPPNGYTVESIKTVNKAGETVAVGKNVDTYITTIELKETANSSNIKEYSITWTIDKATFDLSNVKWVSEIEYTGSIVSPKFEGLPEQIEIDELYGLYTEESAVGVYNGNVRAEFKFKDESFAANYNLPKEGDSNSYINNGTTFSWSISSWEIIPIQIKLEWTYKTVTRDDGTTYRVLVLSDSRGAGITYEYYDFSDGTKGDGPFNEDEIEVIATQRKSYKAYPVLDITDSGNYEFVKKDGSDVTGDDDLYSDPFSVGGGATEITVSLSSNSYVYTGKGVVLRFPSGTPTGSLTLIYYKGEVFGNEKLDGAPTAVGKYWVEVTSNNSSIVLSGETKFQFEIKKSVISTEWNTSAKPPVLRNLTSLQLQEGIVYEYYDSEMHKVDFSALSAGGTFYIRAVLKDNVNFDFDNGAVNTDPIEFTVTPGEELRDPSDINNPNYDFEGEEPNLPEDPNDPNEPTEPGDDKKPIDLGQFGEFMSEYWQPIVTAISIILILIFTGKGIGYASKKRENKRTIESKYSTYYAVAGTGLFGLTYTNWTIVACIMIGVMVLSFVFMLLEKRGYKKSQRSLEDAKEEFIRNQEEAKERRRDEEMKMMFMHMMGGNANGGGQPQGGYAYAGQGLGAEEIRGIVSETMTAMLPNFQQYLPQQASSNDELVEKLIEQNEKLMKKLEEKPVERIVEKEVATANVNDETLEKLANMMQSNSSVNEKTLEKIVKKLQPIANDETLLKVVSQSGANDETIKQMLKTQEDMMRNQEQLMEKILEISANQPAETQVVEKIVEKEVPVEVEKVVEKVVEVPVEVEKIVEKEVVKEVKVEVPVEVEKIVEVPVEVEKVVEKIVEIPAAKPAPKAKTTAPRLTLDEAYEKLSAKQKKIFDTLKAYAMSKDKCKEKKSTYFIVLGQSSTNPLVKLTVKKDTTVALFKMEDEFMKDIRRNATNDGTKVKVKETELIVGDMQALATAKEMVDLREDQIERYNEYLKEQRSMKK